MIKILFFLSSGLFLGWSLGANDAANIFGTAVSTRMVRFYTAAIVCSIFVILGAVFGGAGATGTLGELGKISSLAGAFIAALSAAVTVLWMTRIGLPVSTSQAIVGAIIGWNVFSHSVTSLMTLRKIVGTWFFSPVLSGIFAILLYLLVRFILKKWKIHLLRLDHYTRVGLIITGAFGAYSLGANNIGNVMGVFVSSSPFEKLTVSGLEFSSAQQLFLLGGIAISAGVITYSRRVMLTVGKGIFRLSPLAAFVAVLSSSLVLFVFSSEWLRDLLLSYHLPVLPLVPVSSSQSIVGAVMGISLAQGGRNLNYQTLGRISLGWVATPLLAAIISFILLFFMQNVFLQTV